MFLGIHWTIWLALLAIVIAGIAWFVHRSVKKMEKENAERWARKNAENERSFLREAGQAFTSFSGLVSEWQGICPESRERVRSQMVEVLGSVKLDSYDLACKLESLRESPLAHLVSKEERQQLARTSILRNPDGPGTYKLAKEAWGKGNIPADILTLFVVHDVHMDGNLQEEITDENREAVAEEIAKKGDQKALSLLYPNGVPEGYVRTCLAELLRRQADLENARPFVRLEEVEDSDEEEDDEIEINVIDPAIVECHAMLGEWEAIHALLNQEDDVLRDVELLDILGNAPADTIDKVGAWLACRGSFQNLINLYNPGEEDVDCPPAVLPPEAHLRTCLETLLKELEGNTSLESEIAWCCILLKDWKKAVELLSVLKQFYPRSLLLVELYDNGQQIPIRVVEETTA